MISRFGLLLLFALTITAVTGQGDSYKLACIGFYNVENLFHPSDEPGKDDLEFTPEGSNHYTHEIYLDKLDKLAGVVAKLGTEVTPDGLAVLGLAEVENLRVLEDFVAHPLLRDRNYRIIHFESPDNRGIDVALIYQAKYFRAQSAFAVPMPTRIDSDGHMSFSRDILVVRGTIDGEDFAFLVNHWPSRRGGELATAPLRQRAAAINREIVDSLANLGVKCVVMGDLNDDPVDDSVAKVLRAKRSDKTVGPADMYNPFYELYKKGTGTTAYRDSWSLFDQIILSPDFIDQSPTFQYYSARVYNEPWLTQQLGSFKGYPHRSFAGGTYLGGYSDHFPVYIFIVKKAG